MSEAAGVVDATACVKVWLCLLATVKGVGPFLEAVLRASHAQVRASAPAKCEEAACREGHVQPWCKPSGKPLSNAGEVTCGACRAWVEAWRPRGNPSFFWAGLARVRPSALWSTEEGAEAAAATEAAPGASGAGSATGGAGGAPEMPPWWECGNLLTQYKLPADPAAVDATAVFQMLRWGADVHAALSAAPPAAATTTSVTGVAACTATAGGAGAAASASASGDRVTGQEALARLLGGGWGGIRNEAAHMAIRSMEHARRRVAPLLDLLGDVAAGGSGAVEVPSAAKDAAREAAARVREVMADDFKVGPEAEAAAMRAAMEALLEARTPCVALPPRPPHLVGVEALVEQLRARLWRQGEGDGGGAGGAASAAAGATAGISTAVPAAVSAGVAALHAVGGMGGVGKTTLAREYVRSCGHLYGRGVLWVDASSRASLVGEYRRIASTQLGMVDALEGKGDAEVVRLVMAWLRRREAEPGGASPVAVGASAAEAGDAVPSRRWLLVLDNADAPRELWDAGASDGLGCLVPSVDGGSASGCGSCEGHVLVTTRAGEALLRELHLGSPLPVGCLEEPEDAARVLLRVATGRRDAEPLRDVGEEGGERAALLELAGPDHLAGLPLALVQAGGLMRSSSRSSNGLDGGAGGDGTRGFAALLRDYKVAHTRLLGVGREAEAGAAELRAALVEAGLSGAGEAEAVLAELREQGYETAAHVAGMGDDEMAEVRSALGLKARQGAALRRARDALRRHGHARDKVATLWSMDLARLSPAACDMMEQLCVLPGAVVPVWVFERGVMTWREQGMAVRSKAEAEVLAPDDAMGGGGDLHALLLASALGPDAATRGPLSRSAVREVVDELAHMSLVQTGEVPGAWIWGDGYGDGGLGPCSDAVVSVHRLLQQVVCDGNTAAVQATTAAAPSSAATAIATATSTQTAVPYPRPPVPPPLVRACRTLARATDEGYDVSGFKMRDAAAWAASPAVQCAGPLQSLLAVSGPLADAGARTGAAAVLAAWPAVARCLGHLLCKVGRFLFEELGRRGEAVALCEGGVRLLRATTSAPPEAAPGVMAIAHEKGGAGESARDDAVGGDSRGPAGGGRHSTDSCDVGMGVWEAASLFYLLGKLDECEALAGEALAMEERLHSCGDCDHEHVSGCLTLVADMLRDRGKYDEAIKSYGRVLEVQGRVYGTVKHAHVATTLNNMGMAFERLGKYDEALKHYSRSLEIKIELHGTEERVEVAQSFNNLGGLCGRQGKHSEALDYFCRALRIQLKVYGTDKQHPDVAGTRFNVALARACAGDVSGAAAVREMQAAVATRAAILGPTHPETVKMQACAQALAMAATARGQ